MHRYFLALFAEAVQSVKDPDIDPHFSQKEM